MTTHDRSQIVVIYADQGKLLLTYFIASFNKQVHLTTHDEVEYSCHIGVPDQLPNDGYGNSEAEVAYSVDESEEGYAINDGRFT